MFVVFLVIVVRIFETGGFVFGKTGNEAKALDRSFAPDRKAR